MLVKIIIAFSLAISLHALPLKTQGSAVVLLYHHVDVGTPSITSISPTNFAAHLQYLDDNDFNILPLNDEGKDLLSTSGPACLAIRQGASGHRQEGGAEDPECQTGPRPGESGSAAPVGSSGAFVSAHYSESFLSSRAELVQSTCHLRNGRELRRQPGRGSNSGAGDARLSI